VNRRQLLYLCVALGLAVAGGTQATSTATLQRQASVDIVSQEQGLLAVEQTITEYNETAGTADVSVTVTNQRETGISSVTLAIGSKTRSTTPLASGQSDTIQFFDVQCDSTIRIVYTAGGVDLRMTAPVNCR
jgi:ABC-type glycerol-3-phosphate transport system substrate-binding protein